MISEELRSAEIGSELRRPRRASPESESIAREAAEMNRRRS